MDFVYAAGLRIRQNRYLQDQYQLGILDAEVSSELGSGEAYRTPAFRAYWTRVRDGYSPGFQEYVERSLLPLGGESD